MRVLYVCGYGRSGSTLLGRLLAAQEEGAAVGEAANLGSSSFLARSQCSCGQPFPDCAYWSDVHDRLVRLGSDRVPLPQRSRRILEGVVGLLAPIRLLRRWLSSCSFSESYPAVTFAEGLNVLSASADGRPIVDVSKTTRLTANRPRLMRAAGIDVDLYLAHRPAPQVIASYRAAHLRRGRPVGLGRATCVVLWGRAAAGIAASLCSRSLRVPLRRVTLAEASQLTLQQRSDAWLNHMIAGNRRRHEFADRGPDSDA